MDDFIVSLIPAGKRAGRHTGDSEQHLPEVAVMLAYASHLISEGAVEVAIRPDGQHIKRFDVPRWFELRRYTFVQAGGKTMCAGTYSRGPHSVNLKVLPGVGDVIAELSGRRVIAECKGGIVNTTHPGQKSNLRRGLCEVIGLLMSRPQGEDRHVAVVPHHPETLKLAKRMAPRTRKAGIEIALVDNNGGVAYVTAE